MSKDFANTVLMWEPTRDQGSHFEEIFDPDVKVLLSWRDVEAAVEAGAVVPSEAYALWAYWAAPNSPARLAAQAALVPQSKPGAKPEPHATVVLGTTHETAAQAGQMLGATLEPLEMLAPKQPKPQPASSAWMRILLGVVLAALVVWAAGKGLGLWSK
jgi:hypothetical protein